MFEYLKGRLYRLRGRLSFFLILAVAVAGIPSSTWAENGYDDYLDGWKVACAWSTLSNDYVWDTDGEEMKQPKIYITYRLENANRAYEPGDIQFDIPGIGNGNRIGVLKASDLASDAADSEWDCVWNQDTDIYTFSNKFSVDAGQSLSGGFQMLWSVQARDSEHGYSQRKSPVFRVSGAGQIEMRPLSYTFTSVRDRYRITMAKNKLSVTDYEEADQDYIWYEIETSFDKDWLARGLYRSSYYIAVELPESKNYLDVKVKCSDEIFSLEQIATESGDTVWGFYPFKDRRGDIGSRYFTYSDQFQIGFLKEHFTDDEAEEYRTVTVKGHLDRLYNDESQWITEAGENEKVDDEVSFTVADYSFIYAGYIYSHNKWNSLYESYPYGHWAPDNYSKRLNAVNLYNGNGVQFILEGSANRNYTSTRAKSSVKSSAVNLASDSNALKDEAPSSEISTATGNNAQFREEAALSSVASAQSDESTAGKSQIGIDGNTDEYSLVMGDDKLAIFLTDGSIRNLEDHEYDISYVTIPSDSKEYDYKVYGAETQDTPFDEYVCCGSGNTAEKTTIQFPEGTKAMFVRVDNITGSYQYNAYVGVRLHLDWAAEQQKAANGEAIPDHENHLVNFSYLRSLYENRDGLEVNDCALNVENYAGTYGKELAERDMEVYGECMLRGYSNVWLRSPITDLTSKTVLSPFSGSGKGGFSSTAVCSGSIKGDDSGTLESFSLYALIPDGLELNLDTSDICLNGSGMYYSGAEADTSDFENHVSYSVGEYDGKSMLIADFNFSDAPLEISQMTKVSISFAVTLKYADFIAFGNDYTVYSYLMPHDDGLDKISGASITNDEHDINKNGITSEKMAYSGDSEIVLDTAVEWREYVSKYVRSAYSDGYETETVTRLFNEMKEEEESRESLYSYRLDFGLGSDNAKNIDFFDHIEQGAFIALNEEDPDHYTEISSAWQGTFVSVDTAYAEKMKMVPTVYYSTDPQQELSVDADGWSTQLPGSPGDVKSIWVHLDTSAMEDGLMKTRQMTYVEIHMQAPSDREFIDKKAVNQYYVQYDAYHIGDSSDFEARYELPSAETYVKLLDTVGKITLQKVDADNIISENEDGTRKYAALTGAKFQIYDPDGNGMFEGGKELNVLGQIVLKNIPCGAYQWEELEAPAGYQKINGRHSFVIDGVTEILNIPNYRIPGEVVLTKYDQDDPEAAPLVGAEFELFKENGEQVFMDENGAYSEHGNVGRAVTGSDGTVKITNLPWGNYYFMEIKAPYGYDSNKNPIRFMIGKDQYVPGNDSEPDKILAAVDVYNSETPASILLIKKDAADGRGVKGAVFSLFRKAENGEKEDTLIQRGLKTNASGELQVDHLLYGEYYFVETRNGMGYVMPSESAAITKSVVLDQSTAGQVLEIVHTNERMKGQVILTKLDDAGQLVAGAEYTLMYKTSDGADYIAVEDIYTTNEDGEIKVSDLDWGEYYFVESKAPKGYILSEEHIAFTVDKDTVQTVIYVEAMNQRQKGSLKLIKVDREDKTRTLAGAEYELYRTDGTKCVAGIDYTLSGESEKIVTGDDGTIVITNIAQGGYYLQELNSPESYSVSDEKIRFSVTKENADVMQEITAEDFRNKANIKINKCINEVYTPFGDPTFIFRIEKKDKDTMAVLQTYYKTITLTSGQLESNTNLSVDQGYYYDISEMNVGRYKLTEITADTDNADVCETNVITDLRNSDFAEVTFANTISQYEKLSHTVHATNIVKTGAKLTGIEVEYHGPNPISEETDGYDSDERTYTILTSDLKVKALYDDGTCYEIPASSYMISNPIVDGSSNSYTGTVVYKEAGIERTGTFSVNVTLPTPWKRCWVVMELNGGSIVKDGDTTMTAVETWERQVKEGSIISKPEKEPEKTGYRFKGWYADAEYKIEYNFASKIEHDTHIYAKWAEEYDVKYAVAIYGINDMDADGTQLPLTFGPASGKIYTGTFTSHIPADGEMCIHDMTWEEIVTQARKDPNVFSACLKNGCTHSVLINMTDSNGNGKAIKGRSYNGKMDDGDGATNLYSSINSVYRKWNREKSTYYDSAQFLYSHGCNKGGWPDSAIRNTLNGVVTDNMLTITNAGNGFAEEKLDETTALISCFPQILQDAIYPRAIKSDTVVRSVIEKNVVVTRDKLWLLSVNEYFANPEVLSSSYRHPLEGESFERQKLLSVNYRTNAAQLYAEADTYTIRSWFRSMETSSDYSVLYLYSNICSSANTKELAGVSPCFSIK